jgi:hypothetical protein
MSPIVDFVSCVSRSAQCSGRKALQERARNPSQFSRLDPQELQAAGRDSLRAIAAGLEERGIPAARGGKWSAVQVARLLEDAGLHQRPFEGASVAGGVTVA